MKLTPVGKQFKQRLSDTGAFLEGHFALSSNLHSQQYVQCGRFLQYPEQASWACSQLDEQLLTNIEGYDQKIDVVIGPAYGGIVLAHMLASLCGARALFAERVDGVLQLRRGQEILNGENIVIVDDVLTTGKSFSETLDLVETFNCNVLALACLVDRRDEVLVASYPRLLELPIISLLSLKVEAFTASQCPLCKNNTPLVKPGSRKKEPLDNEL